MNYTSSHKILSDYYASQWYSKILAFLLNSLVGTMQVTLVYVCLLASLKGGTLIYNQYQFHRYRKKWEDEAVNCLDDGLIEAINRKYQSILYRYRDRLDKYDRRYIKSLYTYPMVAIFMTVFLGLWLYIPYTRKTLGYGIVYFCLYQSAIFVQRRYLRPYLEERALQQERERLDREIARQKKLN